MRSVARPARHGRGRRQPVRRPTMRRRCRAPRADRLVLGMECHRSPAGTRPRRDLDALAGEMRHECRVGRDPVLVQEKRPLETVRGHVDQRHGLQSADRVGRQNEPIDLEPAVREQHGLGLAGQAVARPLQPGEGAHLAHNATPARRDAPQHEVVHGRSRRECHRGGEAAEPQTDDRDPRAAGLCAQPCHGRGDRRDRCREPGRVSGRATAVAGPRQLDAERWVTGRGELVCPDAPRPIRAHVVPAPRRRQHDGRRCERVGRGGVEHAERGVHADTEVHGSHVGARIEIVHRSAISQAPARLSAVRRPPRKGVPATVGRSRIRRAWPGSIESASSCGTQPGASNRTP